MIKLIWGFPSWIHEVILNITGMVLTKAVNTNPGTPDIYEWMPWEEWEKKE